METRSISCAKKPLAKSSQFRNRILRNDRQLFSRTLITNNGTINNQGYASSIALIAIIAALVGELAFSVIHYQKKIDKKEENYQNLREKKKMEIEELENELVAKREKIQSMKQDMNSLKYKVDSKRERIEELENKLENSLVLGYKPSLSEVESFIQSNDIDENEYQEDKYNCYDFTSDLIKEAMEKGMFTGYVYLEYEQTKLDSKNYPPSWDNGFAHSFVAFKTKDCGIYFVEPQNDLTSPTAEARGVLQSNTVYHAASPSTAGVSGTASSAPASDRGLFIDLPKARFPMLRAPFLSALSSSPHSLQTNFP